METTTTTAIDFQYNFLVFTSQSSVRNSLSYDILIDELKKGLIEMKNLEAIDRDVS